LKKAQNAYRNAQPNAKDSPFTGVSVHNELQFELQSWPQSWSHS
jgi:hypothetical protein